MSKLMQRFWNDDEGFILSFEALLIATILVIGLIVGLTNVRNAMVEELTELSRAIVNVDQGYNYCGVTGCCSYTRGSGVSDTDGTTNAALVTHVETNITVTLNQCP